MPVKIDMVLLRLGGLGGFRGTDIKSLMFRESKEVYFPAVVEVLRPNFV